MTKEKLYSIIANIICGLAIISTIVLIAIRYSSLPAEIPTHYDSYGAIDGYGSKSTLWILVVLLLVIYIPMAIIERHPTLWNTGIRPTYRNTTEVYKLTMLFLITIKLLIVSFMCTTTIYSCLMLAMPSWLMQGFIGVLVVLMGIFFTRLMSLKRR